VGAPVSLSDVPATPVPKTNRNPISSLRPAPVTFVIEGREYEIPALPALDWLEVLMRPDWLPDDLFVELMPGGIEFVVNDVVDPLYAEDLVWAIVEEVSARHWWVAQRLIAVISNTWDVMGPEATFHNVDPGKLSLAAWMDAMLVLLMQRLKEDKLPMFVLQLEAPPPGEEIPLEEMEMSESQFLSMGD
jgi:hypothetical protein